MTTALRLPTVRLNLNEREKSILLSGLGQLATALAGPLAGYFVRECLAIALAADGSVTKKIPDFDRDLAIAVCNLRKLIQSLSGNKVRLNLVDLTLCGFVARSARGNDLPGNLDSKNFSRKLEQYRKRAKRKTIKHLGADTSSQLGIRCRAFETWCHCFVLHFRLFRPAHPSGPLLHARTLAAQLRALALEVLQERTATIVPDEDVQRIVKLAIAEIRRDRHPFTMLSLLADSAIAKDFLFGFFSKRLELLAMQSNVDCRGPQSSAIAATELEATSDDAVKVVRATRVIDERMVFEASTAWFLQNVPRDLREQVKDEAINQVMRYGSFCRKPTMATTILELIKELRPVGVPESLWDQINRLVEWLVDWVTTLIKDPFRICDVVQYGIARAKNSAA